MPFWFSRPTHISKYFCLGWEGGGGLTMMGIDSKLCFLAGKVQISNDILLDEEGG